MARKPKIEPIRSSSFIVLIDQDFTPDGIPYKPRGWFVRNRITCAETMPSPNWEDYYSLKRVWRKSKMDFESACRFMEFGNLFSAAGIKL